MTNGIAVFLGVLIIGFFALDHFVLHWEVPVFLMRKLTTFIEYLAFWR